MFKFLGKHAAIAFGAGAGKAAMDHTVKHVMGLGARGRERQRGRRYQREINPYSRRYTYTEFKRRYFKGENISNRIAKEFWGDFRYAFNGGLQRYIKETTGAANRGRAAQGRRQPFPILHADHNLTKAHKKLVQQELAGWDGSFTIREVDLPSSLSSLPSALYGPKAGDAPIKESEVVYETRGDRKGPSRLIDAPLRPSRSMVIIAGPGGKGSVVYTAYGGQVAPREPWDSSMNARERTESKKFWAKHALSSHQGR